MNKINYILITLLLGGSVSLNAQTSKAASEMQLADTLSIGYQMNVSSRTSSYSINGVNASAFEKSPYIDISKALQGKVAGLQMNTAGTGLGGSTKTTIQQSFVWKSGRSECISGYRLVSR